MVAKIALIYYSLYGHVAAMAEAIKAGIEADGSGATCDIYQIAETLPDEVLMKMSAPPKKDHPIITAEIMTEYDGFMFGVSGRYGIMSAQIKTFMDTTGGLWSKGALLGKPAGCFFSTATQGGGQETIGLSMVTFFTHHGMIFVPLGYKDPKVFNFAEVHGGSPYGAGTIAGADGSRMPSQLELDVAKSHGMHFASITNKLTTSSSSVSI